MKQETKMVEHVARRGRDFMSRPALVLGSITPTTRRVPFQKVGRYF